MPRIRSWMIAALLAACAASAVAAETEKGKAPPRHGPGASSASPELANLKGYEERRYRIDMMDCEKEKGIDRRICERSVHKRAAAKSRRRGHAAH